MFIKKLFPVFIFLTVSVLFFSCGKDDDPKQNDFDLQVELVNGEYQCSWTAANLLGFEEYVLTFSRSPLPDDTDLNLHPDQYKRVISSSDINEYNWDFEPIAGEYYFQIFLRFASNQLPSNKVKFIDPDIQSFKFDADKVIHYPEKNALYFFNNASQSMLYYDYKTQEKKIERGIDFNFSVFEIGDNGAGQELYLVNGTNQIVVLDANTLEEKSTYDPEAEVTSIVTNEKGWIGLGLQDTSERVRILNRNDWSVTAGFNYSSGDASDHKMGVLSKVNNELIELGDERIDHYILDDNGDFISHSYYENPSIVPLTNLKIIVSSMGNYFACSFFGSIYDGSFNILDHLYYVFPSSYETFLFNEDETELYAISKIPLMASYSSFFIAKRSLPDLELIEGKEFQSLYPKLLFVDEGEVMLVYTELGDVIIRPLGF